MTANILTGNGYHYDLVVLPILALIFVIWLMIRHKP